MKAICHVCMHHCELAPGEWGFCRARKNKDGVVVDGNYGRITSLALDPVEKKPLAMFFPGRMVLSAGSFGCNLRCQFCQNYEISMTGQDELFPYIPPEELVGKAKQYRYAGNIGVAFTYNEPLIGWEYVRDTARLLKRAGLKCVLVTNGSAAPAVLEQLLPYVDAMNIDLKSFQEEGYRKLGGELSLVKEFISCAVKECHVELTTLVVTGENDSFSEMEEEAQWIASLDADIPLHVTRFFPRFHMLDREATDVRRVYQLAETAGKYLRNVFVGNC